MRRGKRDFAAVFRWLIQGDSSKTICQGAPAEKRSCSGNRLTARQCAAIPPGKYSDGDRLWLAASKTGARKWLLRVTVAAEPLDIPDAHEISVLDATRVHCGRGILPRLVPSQGHRGWKPLPQKTANPCAMHNTLPFRCNFHEHLESFVGDSLPSVIHPLVDITTLPRKKLPALHPSSSRSDN